MEELTTKTKTMSMMASQKLYVENISKGLESIIGNMDNYQALCGYNILNEINTLLKKEGLSHLNKDKVDSESINNAIKFCVAYSLNTDNKEVFVIVRNEKRTLKDKNGNEKTYYVKKIECKPQYKGQLKIISSFGKNVKKVYPEWVVREGDEFTYQTFKGVEVIPPTWSPRNTEGKILRVVVPVQYNDGFIDYRIAERESVATNIKAQVKQSIQFSNNKDTILEIMKDMTLDQLLESKEIAPYINDTYTGISKDEMLITKLVINATKRVPIDYKNAFTREILEKTYDNSDVYVKNHKASDLLEQESTIVELEEQPEVKEITTENETIEKEVVDNSKDKDENYEQLGIALNMDDLF